MPCNANFIVAVLKTEICRPKNKVKPSNFVVIKRLREFSSNVPSFTKKNCFVCKMIYDFLRQKYKVDHQILRNFLAQLISRIWFISKITIHFSHFKIQKWVGKWHIILIILYLTKIYKKNAQIGIVRQEYYYWWMIIFQAQNNLKNEKME